MVKSRLPYNCFVSKIPKGQAYVWSRTRMGGWAVAQSPILITTITIKRLKMRGYISLKDYYLRVKSS